MSTCGTFREGYIYLDMVGQEAWNKVEPPLTFWKYGETLKDFKQKSQGRIMINKGNVCDSNKD